MDDWAKAVDSVIEAGAPGAERYRRGDVMLFEGVYELLTVKRGMPDVTVTLLHGHLLDLHEAWEGRGQTRQLRLKPGDDLGPLFQGVQAAWQIDQEG